MESSLLSMPRVGESAVGGAEPRVQSSAGCQGTEQRGRVCQRAQLPADTRQTTSLHHQRSTTTGQRLVKELAL